MKAVIIGILIICSSPLAFGGERYEFYNGIRSLAMGGAGIATVNDETALLVNPAGLGRLRDYFITLVDPEMELGAETSNIAGLNLLKVTDPQEALSMTNKHKDSRLHTRAQLFPSIVVPNFGFGVFAKSEVDAEVNSTDNVFQYDYTRDYAAVLGVNFRVFSGILKLGANVRAMDHTIIRRDDIATSSTGLTVASLAESGLGVGSDAGLILTAPVALLPSIAAVYRDVGGTSYSLRDSLFTKTDEHPDHTGETLDVAMAIQPILGKNTRSTWTVEYRDVLTDNADEVFMRRFHGGLELNFGDAFFLRAGMNQGYWTAGFELSMLSYQFQATSYGEEIGTGTDTREDRRYAIKFALRF